MSLIYLKKLILKSKVSSRLSTKRYKHINNIFQPLLNKPENKNDNFKILELGCAQGKDFLRHSNNENFELFGVDINIYTDRSKSFSFIQSDLDVNFYLQ